MGENRPTAMRGGGMDDVIFAGAASRPPRNYAEVSVSIDNSDRTAPPAFNDSDVLDVVRRITRDVGSAYKANGKETRARDVQMLFADASTGAHSPALVRQGMISELINSKPKARRRILEEAAGISGLYQRRHEAELKLRGAETNLERVADVIEQLDSQLNSLARQARQAKRYREIGDELRNAEGLLLYRRWREADAALQAATSELTEATKAAAAAQSAAVQAARAREEADARVPPLREEEAIAGAVLQRLQVERDTLADQEARARQTIETLRSRIDQLGRDIERETGLNKDAGETIKRLDWELAQILKASEGQDEKAERANAQARDAASVMQEKESELDTLSEDVARLSARHQSAHRMQEEAHRRAVGGGRPSAGGFPNAGDCAGSVPAGRGRPRPDRTAAQHRAGRRQRGARRPVRGRGRGQRAGCRSGRAGARDFTRPRSGRAIAGRGSGRQGLRGRLGRGAGR
jgi:chromosome segregation protein